MARAWVDPDRLSQILVNLLANAGKYSPDGSSIGVDVKTINARSGEDTDGRHGGVLISISDEGPGIPPDQHDLIFRPYYRVPGHATRGKAGVGLGLSISRQLARKLGGDISVRSVEGQGTTFTIHLKAGPVS